MKNMLSIMLLLLLVACATPYEGVDTADINETLEEQEDLQEAVEHLISPFPQESDIPLLKTQLSSDRFERIDAQGYQHVQQGDVLEGIGVQKNIVLHHLRAPVASQADFVARMQSWDLGPLYISDIKQSEDYSKLTTTLNAAQVEKTFDKYSYNNYLSDSTIITTYTKQESVGNALRMRFETYETRSGYKRWAQPTTIYAIPCTQDLLIYLRNPADTTVYSGSFSDIMKNRQHYLDSTSDQMSKKIKGIYELCGVSDNLTFTLRAKEAQVSKTLNERAFLRLGWDYDLSITNLKLREESISMDFTFSNQDIVEIENNERIEFTIELFDTRGDELHGSEIEMNTFEGGDRNNYTSNIASAHDFDIDREDTVIVHILPELVVYEDGKDRYRYELTPLDIETTVLG